MIQQTNIIKTANFILATRDSGYRNLASAIAELIDNSFEAEASKVEIFFDKSGNDCCVSVLDNGKGMNAKTMVLALQFGGSTRFNSRIANGRYGMGLPNGSLSHVRRVDVYSWQNKNNILHSYLDLDEIISTTNYTLSDPEKIKVKQIKEYVKSHSGTLIKWSHCDRLKFKRESTLMNELILELGRIFRTKIWTGNKIIINSVEIDPVDPLFIRIGKTLIGAVQYGETLKYTIKVNEPLINSDSSIVKVKFVELPIEKWFSFSNREKSKLGITKRAGVSILRAGREIDYGWHFMGSKRKENYDDWWRCEIQFQPELDELFGVTHTKQEIHPTDELINILSPDFENIARQLNRRVREKFIQIKYLNNKNPSEKVAELEDGILPQNLKQIKISIAKSKGFRNRNKTKGLKYKLKSKEMDEFAYFQPELHNHQLNLYLNKHHLFFTKVYMKLLDNRGFIKTEEVREIIELLLFAAGRAELQFTNKNQIFIRNFRKIWSENLTNYLQ